MKLRKLSLSMLMYGHRCWIAVVLLLASVVLAGCVSTSTPSNANNICQLFDQKRSWYRSASKSEKRWGIPISVMMAVIYRESTFRATVRPPRKKHLGFIPGRRLSSSVGYSQAKVETWQDYVEATKNRSASRTNFADSIDFVGWYLRRGVDHAGISPSNAEALYVTYHEGLNGYKSGKWRNSPAVTRAAATVQRQANMYESQLPTCRLPRGWFR